MDKISRAKKKLRNFQEKRSSRSSSRGPSPLPLSASSSSSLAAHCTDIRTLGDLSKLDDDDDDGGGEETHGASTTQLSEQQQQQQQFQQLSQAIATLASWEDARTQNHEGEQERSHPSPLSLPLPPKAEGNFVTGYGEAYDHSSTLQCLDSVGELIATAEQQQLFPQQQPQPKPVEYQPPQPPQQSTTDRPPSVVVMMDDDDDDDDVGALQGNSNCENIPPVGTDFPSTFGDVTAEEIEATEEITPRNEVVGLATVSDGDFGDVVDPEPLSTSTGFYVPNDQEDDGFNAGRNVTEDVDRIIAAVEGVDEELEIRYGGSSSSNTDNGVDDDHAETDEVASSSSLQMLNELSSQVHNLLSESPLVTTSNGGETRVGPSFRIPAPSLLLLLLLTSSGTTMSYRQNEFFQGLGTTAVELSN